jgi:hypothetical protein
MGFQIPSGIIMVTYRGGIASRLKQFVKWTNDAGIEEMRQLDGRDCGGV